MIKKKQYMVVAVLAIIIVLLLWRGCNNQQQITQTIGLYEATQDTLHTTRNKLGQQEASIVLMEASNIKLFLKIQSKDSTIIQLQKVVEGYHGKLIIASVFSNETSDIGISPTTITKTDSDNVVTVYPVYESSWVGKWSSGNIKATKDSIYRNIQIENEFEMTQGYLKEKWWKAKQPTVTILNLNPNTKTLELKTFNVKNVNKKLGIGVNVSYGLGTASLTPQFFIGVGINYNIIEIK